MPDAITLKLSAKPLAADLPSVLKSVRRSASAAADPFLPEGFLTPKSTHDVAAAARGGVEGVEAVPLSVADDELLVIEMADFSTLITTASKLRASLERSQPELVSDSGEILFEDLRTQGAASRGLFGKVGGALVGKVFTLGVSAVPDAIIEAAQAKLRKWGVDAAQIGISWLGTKALMWAIESRLLAQPGTLSLWLGARGSEASLKPMTPAEVADKQKPDVPGSDPKPMLVFVHGTASSTLGSFGDLRAGERDIWTALDRQFSGGIYAFEHHTLSESPIDNALQLVMQLPVGAHVSLVTHSRGGLVGDLLCLDDFDSLIPDYRADVPGTGDADVQEAARVVGELDSAHEDQRKSLRKLAAALRDRKVVVQRYVRVASPARGTKLASGNFDVFLSGLLTLIGQVPFFFGQPAYAAFKRVVIEIARNRTNAHLVPGIEAMLPDAPMARLLGKARSRPGMQMAVIAGDIEGGNLLQRMGVLLSDFLLFDNVDNDLVVDTASMLAGIAPQAGARALFDRGNDVSHFRYFTNLDTRFALRDWLVGKDLAKLDAFQELAAGFSDGDTLAAEEAHLREVQGTRGSAAADLPVVVILPGVMGSHLWVNRGDRVWFDPLDIAAGGLAKVAWEQPNVEAEKLFSMFYGELASHLATSHRVERFAYDWRQPLNVLGERFGEYLATLLKSTDKPIRLLAHSMGGLVVRSCIYLRRSVIDELMNRDGARLVMLGTPHQGAHSMVENLLGKGDTLRTLVRLDLKHDMQEVLDIVGNFRGPLQLLPKPGFVDTFQGSEDGGMKAADGARYGEAGTWERFKGQVKDFWFGDGRCATPAQAVLDSAFWLWKQDGDAAPALPEAYEGKSVYVFGVASNTPCGVRLDNGRLKMVGTTRGDGTVSWDSGRIGHIGRFYYLPAEHGALLSTKDYFPAIADLLSSGVSAKLMSTPPATRAVEQPRPVTYDAGPPVVDDGETLAMGFMGGAKRSRLVARPKRRLEVAVKAMDLRFVTVPILVGHYEHDPIAGPQKLIDTELLDGDLSERYSLGLYAGPRGSAMVVLRAPNEQERRRGSLSGAVVTGLGPYERPMSLRDLTESVRAGVLRYLLQVTDMLGKTDREVRLATLLVGFNSSANLTVADSVEALVTGVLEGNAKFFETTRVNIRVSQLDIVEIYLDTAITAVYALRELAPKLGVLAQRQRSMLVCKAELTPGEGLRPRLFDRNNQSYWPRLIISNADRREDDCMPDSTPSTVSAADPGTLIADRLRFLYVGQRARAESVVQQRQPGLVEALVRQQIDNPVWSHDIGCMLFQLMVPPDFKDAARQLDRIVLVVDAFTANLPWELMAADHPDGSHAKTPLALRTPVVRQLVAPRFRRQVRQTFERNALVVGNPSVEGFAKAFPPYNDPASLTGAEAEAEAVVAVLSAMDYSVTREIGAERAASDVLAALYRLPYRFLHISAHGVFDCLHADGRRRSGVVLSGGLLITAAEIDAMELVPELVFLNCCHLGKVDATVRDGNKLAASVARELIQIGVRCVIVAGWAVDDNGAKVFGETFYRQLLLDRQPFGEAVFKARRAVWENNPTDITWGAFQAYGDAGWLAEPVRDGSGARMSGEFASPEEVLDALASLRAGISRKKTRLTERESSAQVRAIEQLLDRMPAGWLGLPMLQSALGRTWADLGEFDKARSAYLAAVRAEDKVGRVPIRDIEQLANVEARLGEKEGNDKQVLRAISRLVELDRIVDSPDPAEVAVVNVERCGLRGSGYKRLASLHARRVLAAATPAEGVAASGAAMREALAEAAQAYGAAEGAPGQTRFSPYNALNRLALFALTLPSDGEAGDPAQRDAALALAAQCAMSADDSFRRDGDFYSAVMSPESLLVQRLVERQFGSAGEAGERVMDEVAKAYENALSNVTIKPKELDTVSDQMCLFSRFHDALAVVGRGAGRQGPADEHRRIADGLIALAERLRPGACRRDDRPVKPARAAKVAKPVQAAGPVAAARRKAAPRKRS